MDNEEIDFDGIPEPVVSFKMTDSDEEPEDAPSVDSPVSVDDAQAAPPQPAKLSEEGKRALELLKEACTKFGIPCTVQMEGQIKTYSKEEKIGEDHIVWYVRGIALANSSMVIPSITDATSELKTEARHLMTVVSSTTRHNTTLNTTAEKFEKAMKESVTAVKESFEATLKNLSAAYEEKFLALSRSSKEDARIKIVDIPDPPQDPKEPVKKEEVTAGGESKEVSETLAKADSMFEAKIKFMQTIGMSKMVMKQMDQTTADAVLSHDDFTSYKTMRLTAQVCAVLKQELIKNLTRYLEKRPA